MIRKIIIFILFFAILILLQTSFFPPLFNFLPNLILIAIILINLLEKPKTFSGVYLSFFGGLFLDLFSENFFGFWILVCLIISIFINFIFKKYVQFVIF